MKILLQQVVDIVKRVGDEVANRAFSVKEKAGAVNLVTSSDLYAQTELSKALCPLVEGSSFVGEEGVEENSSVYFWVVDPIDGTMNFSRTIDEYAIAVALCKGEETLLGVVYAPLKKKLYSALKGEGAWCNGVPIRVSDRPFNAGLFCTAASLYDKRFAPLCFQIIEEVYMQSNDIRRFGSAALELCYLAEGKCELYFEIRVFSWDCTASLLLLSEAGGYASSIPPYAFTKNEKPFPVLAANTKENLEKLQAIAGKYITKDIY